MSCIYTLSTLQQQQLTSIDNLRAMSEGERLALLNKAPELGVALMVC